MNSSKKQPKPYRLQIESRAERDLLCLPRERFLSIVAAIQALAREPRPPGCRKLVGSKHDYRIRVGVYRVIYEVSDPEATVRVMLVRHRSKAYR
jgi:mRNA interferase RelE/StbE